MKNILCRQTRRLQLLLVRFTKKQRVISKLHSGTGSVMIFGGNMAKDKCEIKIFVGKMYSKAKISILKQSFLPYICKYEVIPWILQQDNALCMSVKKVGLGSFNIKLIY